MITQCEDTHQPNMFRLTVVISAFLVVSCLGAVPRIRRPHLNGRIVGGSDVDISEVPYQASLEYEGRHICGGAIISEYFLLTARQCVIGTPVSILRFRAGTSERESGGSIHPVEDITHLCDDCDLSLVMVSVPFEFSANVAPIALATIEPDTGTAALMSGWGETSTSGSLVTHLQKVTVHVVDHDVCNKTYAILEGITNTMICAGEKEGGKDFCSGDIGGPLVVDGSLVGIACFSVCGEPDIPALYSSIPKILQGKRNVLNKHDPRLNKL